MDYALLPPNDFIAIATPLRTRFCTVQNYGNMEVCCIQYQHAKNC